jgi:hypothetical protein
MEALSAATLHPDATTSHQRHEPHPSVEPAVGPASRTCSTRPRLAPSATALHIGDSGMVALVVRQPRQAGHSGQTVCGRSWVSWPCILPVRLGRRPRDPRHPVHSSASDPSNTPDQRRGVSAILPALPKQLPPKPRPVRCIWLLGSIAIRCALPFVRRGVVSGRRPAQPVPRACL